MAHDREQIEKLARTYTEAWCSHDAGRVAAHYVPGGTIAINGGKPGGIAEVAQSFVAAFPDIQVFMDDLVFKDDLVEYHWTFTGTSAETGKQVRILGFEEWTIAAAGLIAESLGTTTRLNTIASSSTAALSDGETGRARLRRRLGGVLAVLAGGRLLHEAWPRPLVARGADQAGDPGSRDPARPPGSLPGPRRRNGPGAGRRRARPLRPRPGLRDLGAGPHRAQLGHPDDAEGRAGARHERSVPSRAPPDLLGHPRRRHRHRRGPELGVAGGCGPGRHLLRLQRDGRGALPRRAVP